MATILAGGVLLAAPGIVTAPILGIAGFGGQGVVGGKVYTSPNAATCPKHYDRQFITSYLGSIAAGVQSVLGNVIGGGAFATLQSAGMGGYGLASVNAVFQGAGVVTSSWGAGSWLKDKLGKGSDDETSQS